MFIQLIDCLMFVFIDFCALKLLLVFVCGLQEVYTPCLLVLKGVRNFKKE